MGGNIKQGKSFLVCVEVPDEPCGVKGSSYNLISQ